MQFWICWYGLASFIFVCCWVPSTFLFSFPPSWLSLIFNCLCLQIRNQVQQITMLRNWLVANESSGSGGNSQGTSQTTDNNIASNDQSPPPNKKKRNEESGFCPQTTEERIKNMKKRKEAGKWREFDHIEIEHTLITKDWNYGTHLYRELFLVPFGMAETMQKHHANKRNTVWNTLRLGVKDSLFN